MTSLERNGTTVTTAAVIAGRSFSANRRARSWSELCERVDALGARLVNVPPF